MIDMAPEVGLEPAMLRLAEGSRLRLPWNPGDPRNAVKMQLPQLIDD